MIIACYTREGTLAHVEYSDEECKKFFILHPEAYEVLKSWYLSGEKVIEIQSALQSILQNKDNIRYFMATVEQYTLILDNTMDTEFENALGYFDGPGYDRWFMDGAKKWLDTTGIMQARARIEVRSTSLPYQVAPNLSQKPTLFSEMVGEETIGARKTEVNPLAMLELARFFRQFNPGDTLYIETTLFDEDA